MSPLVSIITYWIAASLVLSVALVIDQLRRPPEDWEFAGRDRRFWVVVTLATSFHGLCEYVAIAYVVGVLPRFPSAGTARARRALAGMGEALERGWRASVRHIPTIRDHTTAGDMALVAALLVLVSSVIHAVEIPGHSEQYWLYGAFFALAAGLQAWWTATVIRDPLNRRVLLAGAAGNVALILIWAVSRTVGVPIGPQGWHPEAVGAIDILSKLDELAAVVLIAMVLDRLRGRRRSISPRLVRVVTMLLGPLFLFSLLAAFGGGHHHH